MSLPLPSPSDTAAASLTAAASKDEVLLVFGTDWCGDCHRTRRFLDQHKIPYRWVDADVTPGATALIKEINRGRRTVPTLVFPDGSTLSEPSNAELGKKLGI
jgi:glutaredoxin